MIFSRDGGHFMNPNLHDEIAKVAFDLYQKEGCPEGRELIHWLQAEKIVKEKYKKGPGGPSGSTTDGERPIEEEGHEKQIRSKKKKKSMKMDTTPE